METNTGDSPLDAQMRLRIALYLAQRGLGAMSMESLHESGRAAGMNGAEMTANRQGTSHDIKGTACLRFVQAMLDKPQREAPCTRDMRDAGFSQAGIGEVQLQVRAAIATPGETMNCGQTGSRPSPAD